MLVSRGLSFLFWLGWGGGGGNRGNNDIFLLSFGLWACCLRVDGGAGVWLLAGFYACWLFFSLQDLGGWFG